MLTAGFTLFSIGVVGLFLTTLNAMKSVSAAKWPTVEGLLDFADIDQDHDSEGFCHEPSVAYHYQVGATSCISHRYAFGFLTRLTRFESVDEVDKVVWREPLIVYYHPRKPHLSVLQTGIRIQHIIHGLIFGLVILASQFF